MATYAFSPGNIRSNIHSSSSISARSWVVEISALVLVREADALPVVKFAALYGTADFAFWANCLLTSIVVPSVGSKEAGAEV